MVRRLALLMPIYLGIYFGTYLGATLLRFDFDVPDIAWERFWAFLPVMLLVKLAVLLISGDYRRRHRYTTLGDAVHAGWCVSLSAVILFAFFYLVPSAYRTPRSTILIDAALTILAVGGLRAVLRLQSAFAEAASNKKSCQRTLILGGESVGIAMQRSLASGSSRFKAVGLYDESVFESHQLVGGLPVFGSSQSLPAVAQELQATEILIPASTPGRLMRHIVEDCRQAGLRAHIIPTVDELVTGRFKLTVRDVTISDLLRREPNQLDLEGIRGYVTGRRVMVTGAAGSIGSELCRQIRDLQPEVLILVDQSESGIFAIEQEFASLESNGVRLVYLIADITSSEAMSTVFTEQAPELVFHAAAYKHVPLMEQNPREAIRNNVLGTKNLVDLADRHGVSRFVLISTDKAVRPTSLMGASKLAAEKYLQAMADRSTTQFVTVRFGNVLNSAGSVVPTFRRQIEQGGPVTVTHPDMERYFMTIPEAVQLVLQAGAIGETGDVLILDMGDPVKIVDLARDMILLSGLRYPEDIDIVFTGIRPGEKLYEELFYETEIGAERIHEKIFRGSSERESYAVIMSQISKLKSALGLSSAEAHAVLMGMARLWAEAGGDQQQIRAA